MRFADWITTLTPDGRLLFATRCVRLFAYGFLSVVLVLYLKEAGLDEGRIGLLLTLTLLGDTAVSLWITTTADRIGRRKMLIIGAVLMLYAGAVFALTSNFWWLLIAATIGVISPSGNEVGPFLSIEQAALSQTVPAERHTQIFAWYNLVGSLATAAGSLCGGAVTQWVQGLGATAADSYRTVVIGYAAFGLILTLAFVRLTPAAEIHATGARPARFGLHRSTRVVLKLSALFALDAFGGGFVIQSIMAYWFYVRYDVEPAAIGAIFFGANILAGVSALMAVRVAKRIGLINTMVVTHVPSNILLILVPLMPNLPLAIVVLLLRFAISQMDVPTRQAYTMAVVSPEERSAASGVTGVARSVGASVSPLLAALCFTTPTLWNAPFFLAGGIKLVYDGLLYWNFAAVSRREDRGG